MLANQKQRNGLNAYNNNNNDNNNNNNTHGKYNNNNNNGNFHANRSMSWPNIVTQN